MADTYDTGEFTDGLRIGATPGDTLRPGSDALRIGVSRLEKMQRVRRQVFPDAGFSDPAWDLMIVLCRALISQERLSVLRLGQRAHVPPTTTLRQLNALARRGLIVRNRDPLDSRRVFVALSQTGERLMDRYCRELEEREPRALIKRTSPTTFSLGRILHG
jgi:DNA-binding MarR family transcriptional regulator